MLDTPNKKIQQVGVYGFIYNNESQVLIVQRAADDTNPYMWELPGGGLGHGEDPEIGVAREVLEETGLNVDVQFPLASTAKLSSNDPDRHTIRISYFCRLPNAGENIKLSHEHSNFRWINIEESYPLPMSDLFKRTIDTIKKYPYLIS